MTQRYGPWTIEESAGEGGQGHVFVARKEGDSTKYALKRLKNSSRLPRFKAEVEAMASVQHDRIVPIVDYDLEGPKPYYVMPYYELGCLSESRRAKYSLNLRLKVFAQVLEGVAALHRNGITHRDLKPANILLEKSRGAMVADFGICFFDHKGVETLTGDVMGPRHYTAPELESGTKTEVKPSADVYSLGKLLYWLLTGLHLPREGYDQGDYRLWHRFNDPRLAQFDRFFKVSICESEGKRMMDAGQAVLAFRHIRKEWARTINFPSPKHPQRCIYCGVGRYMLFPPDKESPAGGADHTQLANRLGLRPAGGSHIKVMVCNRCRNTQLFDVTHGDGEVMRNPWVKEQGS